MVMTRDEIEAMDQHVLNRYLAEKVMGWKAAENWWEDEWHPSVCLDHAMEAVEKVGLTHSIPTDADGSGYDLQFRLVWLGNLWVAGWGWQEDPAGQVSVRMCGSALTAPLAVCRSVIAAQEVSVT
jgi:hypothetical protein